TMSPPMPPEPPPTPAPPAPFGPAPPWFVGNSFFFATGEQPSASAAPTTSAGPISAAAASLARRCERPSAPRLSPRSALRAASPRVPSSDIKPPPLCKRGATGSARRTFQRGREHIASGARPATISSRAQASDEPIERGPRGGDRPLGARELEEPR